MPSHSTILLRYRGTRRDWSSFEEPASRGKVGHFDFIAFNVVLDQVSLEDLRVRVEPLPDKAKLERVGHMLFVCYLLMGGPASFE